MKIESGRPVSASAGARKAGSATAAPGFAPSVDAPQRAAPAAPTAPLTALDAIIALQSEETPARRRARQAKRGVQALDALEALEEGLLCGHAPATLKSDLERLARGAEATGEAGLDEVLREIDIRLAVELAKLERLAEA
jgi:hypothetical protein